MTQKTKIIKAWAVVARRSKLLKLDLMGTNENPYYSIHPDTKKGINYAEDNCNGYEVAIPVEITFTEPKLHKCNCEFCDKK